MAVVSRPCFDLARFGIIVVVAAEINLATPRGDFAFTMAERFLEPDGSRSTSGDPG